MRIVVYILFLLFTVNLLIAETDYDRLKSAISKNDYTQTAKLLQKILSKDDMPDIKAWLKCGDLYLEQKKSYSALIIFKTAQRKFDFLTGIFDLEDLGLDEDQLQKDIDKRIKHIDKHFKLNKDSKVFNFDNTVEMPDAQYYQYLSETAKIKDEEVSGLLPQPFNISEMNSKIESHIEEYADMYSPEQDPTAVSKQPEETGDENTVLSTDDRIREKKLKIKKRKEAIAKKTATVIDSSDNNDDYTEPQEVLPEPDASIDVDEEVTVDFDRIQKYLRYPEEAKKANIEGNVIIQVLVGKDGKAIKSRVIQSDSPIFEKPATEAVMKSIYSPAKSGEEPVACWVYIPVEFKLK